MAPVELLNDRKLGKYVKECNWYLWAYRVLFYSPITVRLHDFDSTHWSIRSVAAK